ncbi:voltage-gated hydrogen channel 1-like [Babylonia areolata]|uniref:voltage-gated hydrogen channel 1-like n=1 Tax=Babylonia areolata TaxID=304850 RepID=UPI003FD45F9B
MDNLHKMQDDLEKVIEKDDTSSTVTGSDCEETLKLGPLTCRQKLDVIIHSNRFQVGVIVLVIFDVVLVLAELLFDLEIVKLREEHEESVPQVLHYCSLAILSLFLVEIGLRIFVMRLQFFKHKLELFDAVIVIVSFVLDIVFRDREDATSGVGLLVILRLWRVTRILNGIVISVKRQAEKKVEREKLLREACEQELSKFRAYCTSLEAEIEYLHRLLKEHQIPYTEKVQKRPVGHQISVEVEVNHRRGGEEETGGNGGGAPEPTAAGGGGGARPQSDHSTAASAAVVNGTVDRLSTSGSVLRQDSSAAGSSSSAEGRELSADIITLESTTTMMEALS